MGNNRLKDVVVMAVARVGVDHVRFYFLSSTRFLIGILLYLEKCEEVVIKLERICVNVRELEAERREAKGSGKWKRIKCQRNSKKDVIRCKLFFVSSCVKQSFILR